MHAFVTVIRKYPKVRNKTNDTFDRDMRLPYNDQSKICCDCLIQNIILKKLINITGTTITDLDIELKMKNSGRKFLENRLL